MGARNIQWDRTTDWVQENLVNQFIPVASGEGWREERTGLHELEFIETRRHWFTGTVPHDTRGTVHVLNLVEGEEAIVESPARAFEPFVVHYAETFIVPAAVGATQSDRTEPPWGKSVARCSPMYAIRPELRQHDFRHYPKGFASHMYAALSGSVMVRLRLTALPQAEPAGRHRPAAGLR